MNSKFKLYTAGPVEVPQRIQSEISKPILYHRDPSFLQIFAEVTAGIQYLLETENNVLIFTASGTGGMEAAVVNLLSKGDKVLIVEQGKFSSRWSELCNLHGLNIVKITLPWRESITVDQIKEALATHADIKALLITHCETSTGALNDIKSIAEIVHRNSNAIIILDAISTIGVIPFYMDDWGIDVTILSSNKGLLNPPGLVFIALNSKAWLYHQNSNLPKYYFSFQKARDAVTSGIGTAFTPAISICYGVRKRVHEIMQTGLENIWKQHHAFAHAFRSAICAMGLKILPDFPSDSLTVIDVPPPLEADEIIALLREKEKIIVSKGQGKLRNNVIRIGHLGELKAEDLAELIGVLERILLHMDLKLHQKIGVKTFYKTLKQNS